MKKEKDIKKIYSSNFITKSCIIDSILKLNK